MIQGRRDGGGRRDGKGSREEGGGEQGVIGGGGVKGKDGVWDFATKNIKVGLGFVRTKVRIHRNPVYKASHRIRSCGNELIVH